MTRKKISSKISKTGKSKKTVSSSLKASEKSRVKGAQNLRQDIWPMERDVLFRPDRFKYVRKLIKPEGCVFCNAARNEISFETLCIYKSKHSMVVLNKFPYNSGHLLVIPLKHEGNLMALKNEVFHDLQDTLRLAMEALEAIYQPGGMNVGLNHGAVAGAGIPEHLHYHVIPRWSGDLNFFPLIAETKVVVESLEQTYDRLLGYFGKAR